jgi:leucyl aminopeptidase
MVEFKFEKKIKEVLVLFTTKTKNEVIDFINKNDFIDEKKEILKELKKLNYTSKENEVCLLNFKNINYLVFGLDEKLTNEKIRNSFSKLYSILENKKFSNITLENLEFEELEFRSLIDGFDLTEYNFTKYKKDKKKETEFKINFFSNSNKNYSNFIKKWQIINSNVKLCRDLVNSNADEITPKYFEKISKELVKINKLQIEVLNEKQIKQKGLGLLNAVGQGSDNPSRLIIMKYNGGNVKDKFDCLVGKGVTFDTGGLNLKSTGHIEEMKLDMGGAGSVFTIFKSLVELKVKKNLICVLSCAENAIGKNAYKPGDIIKSYKGDFVEILNTDAEGRLVLADAISYVSKNYKVKSIINMATLTGAVMGALGIELIGAFSNDKKMVEKLKISGEETGDKIWELPIIKEHRNNLDSNLADLRNHNKTRFGGASVAAAFLKNFVDKDINWTHLDIAGVAKKEAGNTKNYIGNFGTGVGVRLVVDYFSK